MLPTFVIITFCLLVVERLGKMDIFVKQYNALNMKYKIAGYIIMLPTWPLFFTTFCGSYFLHKFFTK